MDTAALLCNICPKCPVFSDVSHLLTHVSSKAHLSHYFKLQVRSHQEPQAGDLLDEYDQWYKANHLAKLLSDRMASKEARKRKSLGKTPTVIHDAARPTNRDTTHLRAPPSSATSHPFQTPLPHFLDPRLSETFVQASPITASEETYTTPTASSSTAGHPPYPRGEYHLASTVSPRASRPRQWKQEPDADSEEDSISVLQATPRWSEMRCGKSHGGAQLAKGDMSYDDPFVDDQEPFDSPGTEVDKERADEIARLKGVLWPGMDIFDSATEQMRRKRNQKKDESILKMMEKTSLCVEATELVFSPTGILRKERVITGNVDESSPLKGETPIPKRRPPRPKRILSQADPNTRRGQDRKRTKKTGSHAVVRLPEPRGSSHMPRSPVPHLPLGRGGGYYSSRGNDINDFDLSLRAFDSKARNGFAVFHDESNQYKSKSKEPIELDGIQPAFGRRDPFAFNPFQPSGSGTAYASNFAGRAACIPTDKENVQPLLNANGRIDPIVGWHSPLLKRRPPGETGYHPQYFLGDSPHPGYVPFDGHSMSSGYSYNPLAASVSKLPEEEARVYASESNRTQKVKPVARTTSPDDTISEVEEDDFERLYLDGSSY